jgi:hypothetical protein
MRRQELKRECQARQQNRSGNLDSFRPGSPDEEEASRCGLRALGVLCERKTGCTPTPVLFVQGRPSHRRSGSHHEEHEGHEEAEHTKRGPAGRIAVRDGPLMIARGSGSGHWHHGDSAFVLFVSFVVNPAGMDPPVARISHGGFGMALSGGAEGTERLPSAAHPHWAQASGNGRGWGTVPEKQRRSV